MPNQAAKFSVYNEAGDLLYQHVVGHGGMMSLGFSSEGMWVGSSKPALMKKITITADYMPFPDPEPEPTFTLSQIIARLKGLLD